jgi:hypothetical protein
VATPLGFVNGKAAMVIRKMKKKVRKGAFREVNPRNWVEKVITKGRREREEGMARVERKKGVS